MSETDRQGCVGKLGRMYAAIRDLQTLFDVGVMGGQSDWDRSLIRRFGSREQQRSGVLFPARRRDRLSLLTGPIRKSGAGFDHLARAARATVDSDVSFESRLQWPSRSSFYSREDHRLARTRQVRALMVPQEEAGRKGEVVPGEAVKHSQAIARLRAAGRVEVDDDRPGRPMVEVCLSGREVTDATMNDLEALRQLCKLKLRDARDTDAGIRRLQGSGELQEVFLDGVQITDKCLNSLTALKKLETLVLADPGITGVGLKHFKAFDLLRAIYIEGPLTTLEDGVPVVVEMCGRPSPTFSRHVSIVSSPSLLSRRLQSLEKGWHSAIPESHCCRLGRIPRAGRGLGFRRGGADLRHRDNLSTHRANDVLLFAPAPSAPGLRVPAEVRGVPEPDRTAGEGPAKLRAQAAQVRDLGRRLPGGGKDDRVLSLLL